MLRVGFGYDSHRLAKGYKLKIGGITIESEVGAYSFSDGDCLLHALCDALLGAAGLGDIGEHFPNTCAKYKGLDSSYFLIETKKLLEVKNFKIINIDTTVLLEKPKLYAYKNLIKANIANLLEICESFVNIKAKTNEGLDAIGQNLGIVAYVVALLEENE